MSLPSNMEVKEQVRQATDIVELVGSYLPLERSGRVFKALCPWHDDSRPSLQINPDRQSYKCWVCNVGGDVFSFVMKMDGLEFPEALKLLAERAGIHLSKQGRGGQGGPDADKERCYQALAWAEEQFHRYLIEAADAEPARKYLRDRSISEQSVRRFRLGFSPPGAWDWLLERGRSTGYSPSLLERVGLVIPRPQGPGHYDRFRGRLLFSIHDPRGRSIAFGGRVLPGWARADDPKYINSPETPLFSKSNELYGLDLAREAITREKTAIVMEGYTDCIMAHQHGVENVVAVLGTALTERHVPLLRRYADSVMLVLDGDEAGRKRASEVLEIFVSQQLDLRILTLPRDADPCDFIASHGSDGGAKFRELLGGAVDAIEHRIRLATEGMVATSETHRANTAIEQILSTLATAQRSGRTTPAALVLRQQQVLARLAREFHVPEEALRARLAELRRHKAPSRSGPPPGHGTVAPSAEAAREKVLPQLSAWERELLELLLTAPDVIERMASDVMPEDIEHPLAQNIFAMCLELKRAGRPFGFESLLLSFDDLESKSLLVRLDEESRAKRQSDVAQRVSDLLQAVRRRRFQEQERKDRALLASGHLSQQQELESLSNYFAQLRNRQAGSAPTDG
jgi:DNA primase